MDAYSEAIKEGFKPQINTGTATTSAVTIKTRPSSRAVKLYNRSTDIAILYSYDSGTTYLSIPPFGEIDEYASIPEILIKTASGEAVYDLKVALRQ